MASPDAAVSIIHEYIRRSSRISRRVSVVSAQSGMDTPPRDGLSPDTGSRCDRLPSVADDYSDTRMFDSAYQVLTNHDPQRPDRMFLAHRLHAAIPRQSPKTAILQAPTYAIRMLPHYVTSEPHRDLVEQKPVDPDYSEHELSDEEANIKYSQVPI